MGQNMSIIQTKKEISISQILSQIKECIFVQTKDEKNEIEKREDEIYNRV
jgi:hypothetical protein